MLQGKILVTGGAGFIGRAIMQRAIAKGWDAQFTVYSRSEHLQVETKRRFPDATFVLGDVCDYNRLCTTMVGHDSVIHAAALKFIPEGEFNAGEIVRVNIDGARSVIQAALDTNVAMVGISTDKAAAPINIYGASKMVMERLFSEAGFNTVRYGNVLGSTGSVVPVMQRQLAEQGFVQVTNPYMTRFWMRTGEAIETIIAAFDAPIGTVTIPLPRSATMHALAHAVIGDETCGWGSANVELNPCHSKIKYVGARPGEKRDEELITEYEATRTRAHQGFLRLFPAGQVARAEGSAISSLTAPWLKYDELVEMIEEAQGV